MTNTLIDMIIDLQSLVDKGYGDLPLEIYCKTCDYIYTYNGATCDGKLVVIDLEEEHD